MWEVLPLYRTGVNFNSLSDYTASTGITFGTLSYKSSTGFYFGATFLAKYPINENYVIFVQISSALKKFTSSGDFLYFDNEGNIFTSDFEYEYNAAQSIIALGVKFNL